MSWSPGTICQRWKLWLPWWDACHIIQSMKTKCFNKKLCTAVKPSTPIDRCSRYTTIHHWMKYYTVACRLPRNGNSSSILSALVCSKQKPIIQIRWYAFPMPDDKVQKHLIEQKRRPIFANCGITGKACHNHALVCRRLEALNSAPHNAWWTDHALDFWP